MRLKNMQPGYNTNGFAHHRLEDTLEILARFGYESVAITPDVQVLNPMESGWENQAREIAKRLKDLGLLAVVETGSRFILDPLRKHQPTLLSLEKQDREKRLEFLRRCIALCAILGSTVLSFWSGKPQGGISNEECWAHLVNGCESLLREVNGSTVRLAFEPEPGMFIETMDGFSQLINRIYHPQLGLTLDIGHLECMGETPVFPHFFRWKEKLWNIHLSDMKKGVHDHLLPGEGTLDFLEVFVGLKKINYSGGVHWELSRHSHDAVATAKLCMEFYRNLLATVS